MASSPPAAKRVRLENLLPVVHDDDKKPPLPYIPHHVIFSEILPFLSFDELAKLKCVCKSWCNFISSNPMLPLDRFRRRYHDVSSSSYSGVLFPECNSNGQLVFLPTTLRGDDVVPDFLSVSFSQEPCKEIVACTNGLLCLKCSSGNDNDNIYYVCNPLTKETHIIPLSNSWHDTPEEKVYVWCSSIGLAYDPSKTPAQYKLVAPWSECGEKERFVFGFEVFSSQTNEWDKSCNKYYIEERHYFSNAFGTPSIMKSTYAGGVLYWDCCFFLMHFDPEKGYGGTVHFPFNPFHDGDYRIGEFKGHVTLSRVSMTRGMQLWILQDVDNRSSTGCWELMHQVKVSFETVFGINPRMVEIMFEDGHVIHLPYGGGERLFISVRLQNSATTKENVLCYDAGSGKLNKFCTLWIGKYDPNYPNFLYRSSMVSLPKLGKA